MKNIILSGLFLLLFPILAKGAEINLAWNPNSESDLAGYKVYYGTAHHVFGAPIDVGNVTTYTITNLNADTYYITITAYDLSGNESEYSYEIVEEIKIATVKGLKLVG